MAASRPTLRVFRRFNHAEEARDFADALTAMGFQPRYQIDAPVQDPLIVGNGQVWHLVKLPPEAFDRAEAALLEQARTEEQDIPSDHYLHGFSDAELTEILVKPDEWSANDAVLAQSLLRQRGKPVSADAIQLIRKARMDDLRAEQEPQTAFIVLGYVSALLGGLVGIAIGWHINTAKRTLPNGERVPVFGARDRWHAARIFIIGAVMLLA